MMTKTPLAGELLTLSLRALLQKALSRGLSPDWRGLLESEERVALSQLQVSKNLPYQYVSAIAHQLAATRSAQADTLASQLVADMTAYFAQSASGQDGAEAIAAGLKVQPTSEGWLTLTLSPSGLAAWLQIWQTPPLLMPCPDASSTASPTAIAGHWPLGDRLQLSLPMLLQWAYARCYTWHQLILGLPEYEPRSSLPLLPTRDLPLITQKLLPTVIQMVDQMAARSGASPVYWRQGYRLAEQIYRCDAEVGQWQLTREESASLAWSEATLTATQTVLAFILTHSLGMTPRRHL